MKLFKDEKGFGNIIYGVVGLVIFVILISSVAMPTIYTANQSGWTPAVVAMWGILPLVVIASLIMFVIGKK